MSQDDMDELRQWMAKEIGGLRDDRSTASYALEFLKTAQANSKLLHARASLHTVLAEMANYKKWLESRDTRAQELAKQALELELIATAMPWRLE